MLGVGHVKLVPDENIENLLGAGYYVLDADVYCVIATFGSTLCF